MKEKPISLYSLAIFFLLIVISLPLQIMAMYNYSLADYQLIAANLSFPNILVMAVGLIASILALKASRLALASIIIFSFTVIWNNYYVGLSGLDFSLTTTTLTSIGFLLFVGTTLSLGGYKALSNEKWQWWRTTPRAQASVPVVIRPLKGPALKAVTFDISKGGAFIPCELEGWGHLEPGDFINVHMTFGDLKVFRCEAEVVRKNDCSGKYPQGIGIRFGEIDTHDLKVLHSECKNLGL